MSFDEYDAMTVPAYLNRSNAVTDYVTRWGRKFEAIWCVFWTEEGLPFELQLVRRKNG